MANTTSTTLLATSVDDPLDAKARAAIAGFLAGYSGATLVSYRTDLRMFATWCTSNRLQLLELKRAHIEIFGREMESAGRMRSTVARRLSTIAGLFKYCHDEGLLDRNPAANVRRPKVDHESRTLGLDRPRSPQSALKRRSSTWKA
jgi:integrase/recombinase XerD